MVTLEREFEEFKAMHKFSIVKASLISYYKTIQESGIKIPEFMQTSPEKMADVEIAKLLDIKDGGRIFNRFYECCWHNVKEYLP